MLSPFLLERLLLPKVWGGRALETELGIPLPAKDEPIGESWELFDRPEGSSQVRGRDETLGDLVRRCPEEIVGRGVPLGHDGRFPLMLKFLDARQALSLQVHPDDGAAVADLGKNECCVVLARDEDARFVHGVREGVDRDEFLACWDTPAVESMLYSFRPEVGDVVHVPPGTPHGMGPGVVAFEVQENSDLTYRFYDWGRGRETHADAARDVLRMVVNDRPPVQRSTCLPDGGELLIATEHFVVRRYDVDRRIELATFGRFLTVTVFGGGGRLQWSDGRDEGSLSLARNDTALIPASLARIAIEPAVVAGEAGRRHIDVVVCEPGAR